MRSTTVAIVPALALLLSCGCAGSQASRLEEQSNFHLDLGAGYWQAGEVPRAIAELQTALAIDPENSEAHFLLGFIFSGRQMFSESIQHYRQALLLRPDWYECKNNLGVVFLQLQRWEEAETVFQELTQVPQYATPGHAYNNLGWAQLQQGRAREALANFEMAIYLQPTLCLAYNNKGIALMELDRIADSADAFQMAVRRCDSYAEPRFWLARIHQDQGRYLEAHALFEECAQMAPEANLGRRCQEYLER
ncbi:MAG: tetratricopeptide repeat protein [Bradymonadales bacterium]|nr:tetratricopeptide repeat protein [Bradymonadales bacterium]